MNVLGLLTLFCGVGKLGFNVVCNLHSIHEGEFCVCVCIRGCGCVFSSMLSSVLFNSISD